MPACHRGVTYSYRHTTGVFNTPREYAWTRPIASFTNGEAEAEGWAGALVMGRRKGRHGVGIARKTAQLLLCAGLAGCGLSDQFSFMPAMLRYPASAPATESYPDIMALAKTHGRSLFAHRPNQIEISTLLYSEQTKIYTACARVNDGSQHPMMLTMVAASGFFARRRAEANDGCAGQEFFVVDVD